MPKLTIKVKERKVQEYTSADDAMEFVLAHSNGILRTIAEICAEATDYPEFSQEEMDAFKDAFARLGDKASVERHSVTLRLPVQHVKMYFTPWPGQDGNAGTRILVAPPWDFDKIIGEVSFICKYIQYSPNLHDAIAHIVEGSLPVAKSMCQMIDGLNDLYVENLHF